MVLLYTLLRLFLTVVVGLLRWRANRTEIAYQRLAKEVEALLKEEQSHNPKAPSPNVLTVARRQMKIATLAGRQETAESRASAALGWADWSQKWRDAVAGYQGRFSSYVAGITDVLALAIYSERWGMATRTLIKVVHVVIDPAAPLDVGE